MAEVVSFFKIHKQLCSEMPLEAKDYEFMEKNESGIILQAFVGNVKKHKQMLSHHLEVYFNGLQAPKIEYELL